MKRRNFIKTVALGALASPALATQPQDDYKAQGTPHEPEFKIVNGKVFKTPNQDVVLSMCHGCTTKCGIRVRLDNGKIVRCAGNPYHPLANFHHQDYDTPLSVAYANLAQNQELRSTVCSRGASLSKMAESNIRILSPLKRVGKRGEGKWQKISFEQLIKEVVEGGNLFGEGHVDGLRAIFSDELIDKENPEYGSKRNQLLCYYLYDGRSDIVDRFMKKSFGTVNYYSHGGICGGGFRVGGKIAFGTKGFMHAKPDYENAKFNLFWGTAPSNGGNPFQRQAKMLSNARSDNDEYSYAVIDPSVTNAVKFASSKKGRWIPIKSGTDLALCMAIIRWIIENERYAKNYLEQPNLAQAKLSGEIHHSNATHLVIVQKDHPDYGKFARVDGEALVCSKSGKIQSHLINEPAKLFFDDKIDLNGEEVGVKSSMQLLKESAFEKSLKEYSKICGVSQKDIVWLGENFTKNGKKVNASVHGGMMSTQAAMSTYSIFILNTLLGTYGYKGGSIMAQGGIHNYLSGRYELASFEGAKKASGINLSRSGAYYENSSEFKRKVKAGLNPYPATQPWYPLSMPLINEALNSSAFGYPYKAKVFINYMTNVVYNQAGANSSVVNAIKDSKNLPLFIAIDAFMNETNAYSDYIVPDGVNLENWALPNDHWGILTKASTIRYPALKARQDRDKNGELICVEHFFIQVAKELGLAGFGKNGFKDKDGKIYPLNKKEQFYAASLANLAFDGNGVSDITKEDEKLAPIQNALNELKPYLKKDEIKKVAKVLSRGGRFDDMKFAYQDEVIAKPFSTATAASIYYEPLGSHKHSITGEFMSGTPKYMPQTFSDATPIEKIYPAKEWKYKLSTRKSNIQHYYTSIIEKLKAIHPHNYVRIAQDIGEKESIKTGDLVKVVTPNGEQTGVAFVTNGVVNGEISIEHGYGHDEFGARAHYIDGVKSLELSSSKDGINHNKLGLLDPTRNGKFTLGDFYVGTCARQALPAKIYKV